MTTARYLITTADERTWAFDRPVLFLGEWCRAYDRRDMWRRMNAVVAPPYGAGAESRARDLASVQATAAALLPELAAALNALHGTAHGARYWHIVLGHWLRRFVAVAFNRYRTIEQALAMHAVSGTLVFASDDDQLVTPTSDAFVWAVGHDDVWNHYFYARVLEFLGGVPVEVVRETLARDCRRDDAPGPPAMSPSALKRRVRPLAARVLARFSRRRDALILNSYLPLRYEAQLQLALGQCPQLWRSPVPEIAAPDSSLRTRLRLGDGSGAAFDRFVRVQLPEVIPTCYVEGYRRLVEQAESLPWPSEPKFVFTSNSFDTDEVFKLWAAAMAQRGVPYFTGQHGNNYGTLRGFSDWPEVATCDTFFTWGWTSGAPRAVPAFVFKTAGRGSARWDETGGLLLVEVSLPHRITPWDNYSDFGVYQEEQFRFVEALPARVYDRLTVRLYRGRARVRWHEDRRWAERCSDVRIDPGAAKIFDLIARQRLVVHSYDSTGILETLSLNIPTLCFWHGGLDHLEPRSKPYYELLRSAGILHDTPEAAAQQAAACWDDVGAWWNGAAVQEARRAFCAEYARATPAPVQTLRRLLTAHTAAHVAARAGADA